MLHQARAGRVDVAAACLLAYQGIEFPTPEQVAGAGVLAAMANDLHVLACGKTLKE